MKKGMLLGLVASSFVWAGVSFAADEMKPAFGNTVQVKHADGTVDSYYMNADGTFTAKIGGKDQKGTWVIKDGKACSTLEGGQESCGNALAGRKPGDSWEETGSDGSKVTVSLVAGR